MEETTQYNIRHAGTPANRTQPNQAETIDLYEMWLAIMRHFWSVVCAVLVGACIAADITFFLIPSTYTSSALMLVQTKESTEQTNQDLQADTSLTNDYQILIYSRPVLEKVIKNLKLDMDYASLRSMVSVTKYDDTRILDLSVVTTDPELSAEIVNELSDVSADYISDKMDITPPKIVEEGEVPTQRTSPSMKRNTVIGALIGLLAAVAVIVIREMIDDTLTTEEDVERYLGLVTLAVVPEKENGSEQKHSKRRKKHRSKRSERSK